MSSEKIKCSVCGHDEADHIEYDSGENKFYASCGCDECYRIFIENKYKDYEVTE